MWKEWHSSHPLFDHLLAGAERDGGKHATTQLAHSIAFVAMIILLIKLMLVLLRSCGRTMFHMVVWLGFNVVANSISPSGLNTDLVYV